MKKLPKYVIERDGQWYVRRNFPNGRTEKGRIIYTQVVRQCEPQTKERAAQLATEIETMYLHESRPRHACRTVKDAVRDFVKAKEGTVSIRTSEYYDWMYRKYIESVPFGRVDLEEVTPLTVQRFYSGPSPKMIRKIHIFLSMAFKQAVRWEVMTRNPCEGVILPRPEKADIEIMTPDEIKAFMKVCLCPRFLILAFSLETGARPGEVLALQWKDVDIKNGLVKISRSVGFQRGGGFYFKPPKTPSSKRTIEIGKTMCEHLSKRPRISDLVFPARNGTPMSPGNLSGRKMTQACVLAKIPRHSIYSLRHSSATMALAGGANIKAVSERLGHSSIQITLDTYAHVLEPMRSETANILAEALYG